MYEVNHIGIIVEDAEKAAEFYSKQFGSVITRKHKDERLNIVFVKSGDTVLELIQYLQGVETARVGSVDHVAFTVPNMEEAVEKLKTDGVRLISQEPRPFENDRVFFFKGLNGEKLEFVQIGE